MKKVKYLIGVIIICAIVFIGVEIFRDKNHEEEYQNANATNTTQEENTNTNNEDENVTVSTPSEEDKENEEDETNTTSNESTTNTTVENEKIQNGEQLMKEAKTLTARGWAGASNNVIGLKDGVLYYYNKGTGEFYQIAEGVEDIYFKAEYSEDITAKKGNNFKEIKEAPTFLIYE